MPHDHTTIKTSKAGKRAAAIRDHRQVKADAVTRVLGETIDRDAQIRQAAYRVVDAFERNQLIAETAKASDAVKVLRAVLRLHATDADKATGGAL